MPIRRRPVPEIQMTGPAEPEPTLAATASAAGAADKNVMAGGQQTRMAEMKRDDDNNSNHDVKDGEYVVRNADTALEWSAEPLERSDGPQEASDETADSMSELISVSRSSDSHASVEAKNKGE